MIPAIIRGREKQGRIPRESGDDPGEMSTLRTWVEYSPRERG